MKRNEVLISNYEKHTKETCIKTVLQPERRQCEKARKCMILSVR